MLEDLAKRYKGKNVLVLGIGGGGDVVSTVPIAGALERLEIRPIVGSIMWERFAFDPVPGPIRAEELVGAEQVNSCAAWIKPGSYAVRGGRKVTPQAARVAAFTMEGRVLGVDVSSGAIGVAEGLDEILRKLGADLVFGIDAGGDILAEGAEETLWSPLADQLMLATLFRLTEKGHRAIIGVHGIGADGELDPSNLLARISLIAEKGGYLGARGLTNYDVDLLEGVLKSAVTEASALPVKAAKGVVGKVRMREGTRHVDLSIVTSLTFFLDVRVLYNECPMAKAIYRSGSLREVREILNGLGVYTELDLEEDLKALLDRGEAINETSTMRVRREGRERLTKKAWRREPKIK